MQTEIRTEDLRKRHQEVWNHDIPFQEQGNAGLALRTYRAIDWTHRGRMEHSDNFAAFLFYWIAFNALYGAEPHNDDQETNWKARRRFFEQLVALDVRQSVLARLRITAEEASAVLAGELAYAPDSGISRDVRQRRAARFRQFVRDGETTDALGRVFDALNRVRNWVVHGGIAWRSHVMAPAMADGTAVLTWLVPTFIDVMLGAVGEDEWDLPPLTPDRYEASTSAKDVPALDTPAQWR